MDLIDFLGSNLLNYLQKVDKKAKPHDWNKYKGFWHNFFKSKTRKKIAISKLIVKELLYTWRLNLRGKIMNSLLEMEFLYVVVWICSIYEQYISTAWHFPPTLHPPFKDYKQRKRQMFVFIALIIIHQTHLLLSIFLVKIQYHMSEE